jgi:hypothetical protein
MQDIHPSAWLAPSAQLFGRIVVADGASIWHNAVLRAECQEIRVGRMTNVQDFVMMHVPYDRPTIVGAFCSITHHVTLHGCTIEDDCLIGINATVMDGAGRRAWIDRRRRSLREGGDGGPTGLDRRGDTREGRPDARQRAREPTERVALSPECRALPTGLAPRLGGRGVRGVARGEAGGSRTGWGSVRDDRMASLTLRPSTKCRTYSMVYGHNRTAGTRENP